jgi:hypothetical protein
MHQLVLVHGVNTRKNGTYDLEVANRDALFKETAWAGTPVNIRNPYWGKWASRFTHDLACLPSKGPKSEAFGLPGALMTTAPTAGAQAQPLSKVAATDFGAAVDAIFVAMVEQAEATGKPLTADQIAKFNAAGAYALDNEKTPPAWATTATSDQALVGELRKRVAPAAPEAFGLIDDIGKAATALADRARNLVSSGVAPIIRDQASPLLARFLGDVFVYLYGSGPNSNRSQIRAEIAKDINAAAADAKPNGDMLVLIGHSLGGVILCDMLGDRASGIDPGVKVDLLVTVGSQPGLFQEMSLLDNVVQGPRKAPHAGAFSSWFNVYDPVDLLSFRCEPIFQDVTDFAFSSVTGMIDAHSSYFKRPRFYARLRERLKSLAILP